MALYLVTGGAGFIGSNLVACLIANRQSVRVLDNLSTGSRENLTPFMRHIELVEGDIRNRHVVHQAMAGVDYVLHQAALPSVLRSVRDPVATNEVNVIGTLNLLMAARDAGVKRFVAASSSSVYGATSELPKRETMCPQPLSPYAVSKLACEQHCQVFWQLYGLETVCLRYFNVFGPRQDPSAEYAAVIPRFIQAIWNDGQVMVHGDGRQSRDFTYVDNVVHGNLLACKAGGAAGTVMNIACGDRNTILDLIEYLSQILGKEPHVVYSSSRPGDVPHSQADINLAQTTIGFQPVADFSAGLRMTVDWYLASVV